MNGVLIEATAAQLAAVTLAGPETETAALQEEHVETAESEEELAELAADAFVAELQEQPLATACPTEAEH